MTQKAAIGNWRQVLFSREVVSIWMRERPLSDSTASDSHGVTDCGHKRFVIADYLLDNSNCTIIHTGGACVGKTVPVSGKPLRPCCAAYD